MMSALRRETGDGADAGAPTSAIGAIDDDALGPVRDRLEAELAASPAVAGADAGHAVRGGDGVTGYRDSIFTTLAQGRPVFTLAWPDHLYIPGQADHREYWFVPPPDDHRYRYAYAGPPGASTADAADGRLFAWVNTSGLEPGYTGYAGVGARITPSATLAYLTIGADMDLLAEARWWYLPGTDAGYATFSYRAAVFVAAWVIDPVSGRWELLRPFASRTLLAFRESGQGGSAVVSQRHAFDDLTARVQVQAGRQYAVTASFEVTIAHDCRDRRGARYVKQPGDDIRLWASLTGQVASITASTTVLVP